MLCLYDGLGEFLNQAEILAEKVRFKTKKRNLFRYGKNYSMFEKATSKEEERFIRRKFQIKIAEEFHCRW